MFYALKVIAKIVTPNLLGRKKRKKNKMEK